MTPSTITEQTMSSREIAVLVEKRHDNVKRTIETLKKQGAIGHPQIEDDLFQDAQGKDRSVKVFRVGKRDSYVIVAQLSPLFTARLVDRWQALEDQVKSPALDYSNPAHALKFVEEQAKRVVELTHEVGAKTEALDTLTNTNDTYSPTEAAKQIGMAPKALIAYMRDRDNGWLYRRRVLGEEKGPWIAFQTKLDAGHLKVTSFNDKSGKSRTQIRVTKSGVVLLAQQIAKKTVEGNQIEQR